jgi:hypothetical protein
VVKWCSDFKSGRVGTTDNERSGRLTASNPKNKARVEAAILGNRRVTVSELEHDLGLSHRTIVRITLELGFHNVCARWVLRALLEDHKAQRMVSALSFLQQYAIHGNFFRCIVTGDETWVHHHSPETKRASMEWKHPGSPRLKKFNMVKSADKVMAKVFWDSKGVLLVDFMEKGTTINAASYCATLEWL